MNPYEVLGLPKEATDAEVKSAFKRRAKAAHPDTGGSAEAFAEVKLAHTILSDPERRAKYDATGEIDEPKVDVTEQAAMNVIGGMLAMALQQDSDPFANDLVAQMIQKIVEQKQAIEKSITTMERSASRAKRMKDRFTRKGEGENRIVSMLEWQRRTAEENITAQRQQLAIGDRAIEILKDYRFQADPSQQRYDTLLSQMYGVGMAQNSYYGGIFDR